MIGASTPSRMLLGVLTALAAGALGWACLRTAAVGYFVVTNPTTALRWNPNSAAALARAADVEARAATTERAFEDAARLARRALVLGPLESSALRVLALDADRRGRDREAAAMMAVVGQRTHRDTLAQAWLMNRAFEQHRYAAGFANAGSILQRAPEWGGVLFPVMVDVFDEPAARGPMQTFLAAGPEWRRVFLSELAANAKDVEALRGLYLGLKAGRMPPTDEEIGEIVGRLIADGRYADAEAIWRQLLPRPAQRGHALIYDGEFRGAPGGPPFNWGLASDASAVAEIGQAPDGSPALYVRFPAGEPTPLAEQLLVLPPGDYELSGRVLYDDVRRPERLNWRLQCADGEAINLAAPTQDNVEKGWRAFKVAFTVPAAGCPGQWLQLGSQAEENFGMIEAWFTALSVRRMG